ncbi:MAG: hypothetical protein NXI10_00400 [bacterium]|nr:hypothetical protein [bacterium]
MSHYQNIQRTLEAMFKKQTPKSGMLRLNQGMQFDRPGGPYLVLVVMVILVASISLIFNGNFIVGLAILPLLVPISAYIMDIQGIEVDFKNGKIRKYRSFLGIRTGNWHDLGAFDSVRVYQHKLKTRRGLVGSMTGKKYDTDAFYYVRLVSLGLNKSISLLELDDYNRAKYQAEKVARHSRLIFIEKPARLKTIVVTKTGFESDNA